MPAEPIGAVYVQSKPEGFPTDALSIGPCPGLTGPGARPIGLSASKLMQVDFWGGGTYTGTHIRKKGGLR
jgi:hypothetical protein